MHQGWFTQLHALLNLQCCKALQRGQLANSLINLLASYGKIDLVAPGTQDPPVAYS